MRRRIQGLHDADQFAAAQVCDGLFLVRVERAQHRWHARKPFYLLRFSILEPQELSGQAITGRLYCTSAQNSLACGLIPSHTSNSALKY